MGKNLLVYKASAGSGKTFNLARIYIEELLRKDGTSIDQKLKSIMAITFTHKAANEMKTRVIHFLHVIADQSKDPALASLLSKQISEHLNMDSNELQERASTALELLIENFGYLSISTIDSFSHRIIRSFSKEMNLHYDFEVSMDRDTWLEMAVDRIFDRFGGESQEDKELSETLIHFFLSQIEESNNWNLKWMVNAFAGKNFNDELYDNFQKYPELEKFNVAESVERLTQPIKLFKAELKELGLRAMEVLASQGIEMQGIAQAGRGAWAFFKRASELEKIFEGPNSLVIKTLEEGKWASGKIDKDKKYLLESIEGELHAILSKIIDLKHQNAHLRINELLFKQIHYLALSSYILKELDKIKEEENTLLIGDFNRLIENVVKNEAVPFIYERIGERYQHFLLDEFQDTSIKQWHNFIPLLDNAIASENRNLIVGDSKQAIYRFREGEVELFADLPKIYQSEGDLFEQYETNFQREYKEIVLEKNFRSAKSIVDFNNQFFEQIKLSLARFSGVYDDLKQEAYAQQEGYWRVDILDHKRFKEEEELYEERVLECINEAIEDGFEYKDIAILTRDRKSLRKLSTYLSRNGIQIESDESLELKKHADIEFLISVMSYLLRPQDKNTQYELYKNLNFKYSDDPIKELQKVNSSEILLEEKLREIEIELSESKLRSLSLLDMIKEIERLFDMGLVLNAYYSTLLDIVEHFVLYKGNHLDEFLQYWEDLSPSISSAENPFAIKLLTIHRSKGLEFPVVILPFLDWQKKLTKSFSWLDSPESINDILPKVFIKYTKDLLETELADDYNYEELKSLLDDINLLYVAFTRPEERFYAISSTDASQSKISSEILMALKAMGIEQGDHLEGGKREARQSSREGEKPDKFTLTSLEQKEEAFDLKIAYEFKKYKSVEGEMARSYGEMIHKVLAEIKDKDDLQDAFERLQSEGLVQKSELDAIKEKLSRIIKMPACLAWFDKDGEKFIERELVNAKGEKLRPDRVISFSDKTILIDFKTGSLTAEKLNTYKGQLMNYAAALNEMSYPRIESHILSIDEERVISF